jgi:hypothetical protein
MASHFVGLNRGQEGALYSDFTTGTSTGSTDVELRVDDGKNLTKKDVHNIIEAFERFFENNQQVSTAGFVLSDGKTS